MSVGPTRGPVQRPSDDRDFTEIFQRLDDLERALGVTGWRFNFDNEGGSGYVQFNDPVDIDTMPDPLGVGGSWGAAFEDASGQGLLFGSTTLLSLISQGLLSLLAVTSPLTIVVNGNTFEFRDDGSIHGPVGGNVVFDL